MAAILAPTLISCYNKKDKIKALKTTDNNWSKFYSTTSGNFNPLANQGHFIDNCWDWLSQTDYNAIDFTGFDLIGDYAFVSITTENSLFIKAPNITHLIVGNTCSSIGIGSFMYSSLMSVDLGKVTSIGNGAFYSCLSLTSIVDSSSVTTIGNYAFAGCLSLKSIDLSSVTTIEQEAFLSCEKLASIDLNKATRIGNYAFGGCSSLVSITYTTQNVTLGDDDYVLIDENGDVQDGDCTKTITNGFLTQHKYVKSSGDALQIIGCLAIGNIKMPSTVTEIGSRAFYESSLKSIDLSSATTIGNRAFLSCEKLASIDLKKVTSIGYDSFKECPSLASITYTTQNVTLGDDDYVLIDENGDVQDGDCTKTITNGFLTQHKYVKSSGDALQIIGSLAIGNIKMPSTVTEIGGSAFNECYSLKSVDLSTVGEIDWSAFVGCMFLTSVDLGKVNIKGGYAFGGCISLFNITSEYDTAPSWQENEIFVNVNSNGIVKNKGNLSSQDLLTYLKLKGLHDGWKAE